MLPRTVKILYEDAHCLVADKPPFILTHPSGRTKSGTLSDFVSEYACRTGVTTPVTPMHRLDRDTSGCVLFAKTKKGRLFLSRSFSEGLIRRRYLAYIDNPLLPATGTFTETISVDPRNPNRRRIDDTGLPAITHYRMRGCIQTTHSTSAASNSMNDAPEKSMAQLLSAVSNEVGPYEVELEIPTGRTHQIRVHLAYHGHPVLGDAMYGVRRYPYTRQCLHAYALSFPSPSSNEMLEVVSPLPINFGRETSG